MKTKKLIKKLKWKTKEHKKSILKKFQEFLKAVAIAVLTAKLQQITYIR